MMAMPVHTRIPVAAAVHVLERGTPATIMENVTVREVVIVLLAMLVIIVLSAILATLATRIVNAM